MLKVYNCMLEMRSFFKAQNQVSNAKFGYTFFVVFLLVAAFMGYKANPLWYLPAAAAGIFGSLAILKSNWLFPFNQVWFYIGLTLQLVFSPIMLFILYAVFIIPVGFLRNLKAKKPITLGPDKELEGYWIPSKTKTNSEQFKHLF